MGLCKRFGCLSGHYSAGLCFDCYLDRGLFRLRLDRAIEEAKKPIPVFAICMLIFIGSVFWMNR